MTSGNRTSQVVLVAASQLDKHSRGSQTHAEGQNEPSIQSHG